MTHPLPDPNPDAHLDTWIATLRCPVSGEPLRREKNLLIATTSGIQYPIRNGIPMLLPRQNPISQPENHN